MTDRKPPGMSFTSWIDQQISEATERGLFDDLPGAGQPLPKRDEFDGQTWVREYVAREGGSIGDCLPTPLKLRREIERLSETVAGLPTECQVREVVDDLNKRILEWRRLPLGPPVFVPLADAEATVAAWRAARPPAAPAVDAPAPAATGTVRRWRLRRSRKPQE